MKCEGGMQTKSLDILTGTLEPQTGKESVRTEEFGILWFCGGVEDYCRPDRSADVGLRLSES